MTTLVLKKAIEEQQSSLKKLLDSISEQLPIDQKTYKNLIIDFTQVFSEGAKESINSKMKAVNEAYLEKKKILDEFTVGLNEESIQEKEVQRLKKGYMRFKEFLESLES